MRGSQLSLESTGLIDSRRPLRHPFRPRLCRRCPRPTSLEQGRRLSAIALRTPPARSACRLTRSIHRGVEVEMWSEPLLPLGLTAMGQSISTLWGQSEREGSERELARGERSERGIARSPSRFDTAAVGVAVPRPVTPCSPLILYAWRGEAKNSSEARALSATFSCAPSVVESSLFSAIARVALLRLRQVRSRFYGGF